MTLGDVGRVRQPLFCGDLLHDFDFKVPFRPDLLQLCIFLLQLMQALHASGLHVGKPLAPFINRPFFICPPVVEGKLTSSFQPV
jgi:hypothetical protein